MGHAPVPALFVHSVVAKTTLDTTAGASKSFVVPAYNTLTITMQGGGGGGCSQSGFGSAGTNATISFTGFSAQADGGGGGNTSTGGSGGGASGNNVVNTAGSASSSSTGVSGAGAPPTGGAAAGVQAAGNIYGGGGGGSASGFLGGGGGGYGKSTWTAGTAGAPKQGSTITYTVPGNASPGAGSPSGGVGAKGYVQFVVA